MTDDVMHGDAAVGALPPDLPDPRSTEEFWAEALGGGRVGRSLVQSREVRDAIRGERYRKLYGLFRKQRKAARSREETSALDAVLANRRLFLEDLRSAPDMITWWGFGTTVHGRQDADPREGTYIGTYFLSALYVPLWPLKQYLVADAENGGWHFLGRVPLSPKVRVWRRLAAAGAVALVLAIVFLLWRAATHDDVYVLNALPDPVHVSIGEASIVVPPGGRALATIPSGTYEVVVTTPEGRELERTSIEVVGGQDLAVYNVLGAAPLYVEEHSYGAAKLGSSLPDGATYLLLAGTRWVSRDDIDFVFEPAPEKISLSKGEKGAIRLLAGVHGGGLRTTFSNLGAASRLDEMHALARRVQEASPGEAQSLYVLYNEIAGDEDTAKADAFITAARENNPTSIHVHRLYQDHFEGRGEEARLIEEYRALHEASPEDPDKAYLFSRVGSFEETRPLLERMVEAHPEHPWLRRGIGWQAYHRAEYEAALAHYERIQRLVPEEAGYAMAICARCLVALGQEDAARTRLERFLRGCDARHEKLGDSFAGASWLEIYGIYALLRWRMPDGSDAASLLSLLRPQLAHDANEKVSGAIVAGFARNERHLDRFSRGLSSDEVAVAQSRLELQSKAEPRGVARRADQASPEVRIGVDAVAAVAIIASYAVAERLDDAKDLIEIIESHTEGKLTRAHFEKLPSVDGLHPELDLELRAAFLLAAAYRETDAVVRERLMSDARLYDSLGRVVPR